MKQLVSVVGAELLHLLEQRCTDPGHQLLVGHRHTQYLAQRVLVRGADQLDGIEHRAIKIEQNHGPAKRVHRRNGIAPVRGRACREKRL